MFDFDLGNALDDFLKALTSPGRTATVIRESMVDKPIDSGTRYDDMDMGYRQTHNK